MIPLFASITHNPFSYQVGPLELTGFGLAVLLAFAIGQIVSQRELWRRGYDPTIMADAVFAAVIGGLLGAIIAVPLVAVTWSVYSRLHTPDPPMEPDEPAEAVEPPPDAKTAD